MVMDENAPKTEDINCPFLKMANPDTSSYWKFLGDVSKAGMSYSLAMLVHFDNVSKQKGLWKALTGHTLDLYALNQVHGISHPDKYNRHKQITVTMLEESADKEGNITLQDLVDVKKHIAVHEEHLDTIMESSKNETMILFVVAGGNLKTGKVSLRNALALLEGKKPDEIAELTLSGLLMAKNLADWGKQEDGGETEQKQKKDEQLQEDKMD